MGGGDLNMKKSWHPLLLKNQERVWLEEKKTLEEKKKLDQLRKEKEEERQLQELQRLQEEQTGKKRTEKLEWMYATPATGSSQNPNDLEDYLLGKKRVDKLMVGDDNAKLGAAHKSFIAVQNANNARDITAKIREDPLLAIKQQEQAAIDALRSNPLRLKQLQRELGVAPKKDKKDRKAEKEERKRLKKERRRLRERDSRSASPRRRSPTPNNYHRLPQPQSSRHHARSPSPSDERPSATRRSRYSPEPRGRSRTRSPSPKRSSRTDSRERYQRRSPSPRPYRATDREYPRDTALRYLDNGKRRHSPSSRQRSPSPKRYRREHSPSPRPAEPRNAADDRAARLAAMSINASSMNEDRQKRLAELLEKEKAELEEDLKARARSKGMSNFLSQEQKKVYGGVGGLEERIKRGRGGMRVEAD